MDIRVQPTAFICSSAGRTVVLAPVKVAVKEGEDYKRVMTLSWRCSEAESCQSKTCYYSLMGKRKK